MLGGELGTMDDLSREFSKQIQTVDGLISAIDAQVNVGGSRAAAAELNPAFGSVFLDSRRSAVWFLA